MKHSQGKITFLMGPESYMDMLYYLVKLEAAHLERKLNIMKVSPKLEIVPLSSCVPGSLVRRIGHGATRGVELVCESEEGLALVGIELNDFELHQFKDSTAIEVMAFREELLFEPNVLGYFEPYASKVYETPGALMLDNNGLAMNVVINSPRYMMPFVTQIRLPNCVVDASNKTLANAVFFGRWTASICVPQSSEEVRHIVADFDCTPTEK